MLLKPLTSLTLKQGKKFSNVLNKLGKKDQTLNPQKKEIIQNFYKLFVKENKRKPQKNEFDRLLSGKGVEYSGSKGHRYTKSKTLVEGLEFGPVQNVTYENFIVKQARGKANKITDPYFVSAGTRAGRKRRGKQKKLGENINLTTKEYSVGPKQYGDIIDPKTGDIVVEGYQSMGLKPYDMTLSHGARNRKLTKDTLRIAPGKLNLLQEIGRASCRERV